MKPRILILGDIHFPYHNKKAVKWALEMIKKLKPTHIVQIGDLYDQYSFSRFTKKNITSPEKEIKEAQGFAKLLWKCALVGSRDTRGYQILGNHDIRLIKRAEERLPEAQSLIKKSLMELYTFDGVTTLDDDREILRIGKYVFHHGYLSKLGDHAKTFGECITVGHSHTGGVVFEQRKGKIVWELNAGYLADETSEPLRYRPTKISKWTLGIGFIDEFGPRFIPYGGK